MNGINALRRNTPATDLPLFQFFWRRFIRHRMALVGGILLLCITSLVVFAPFFLPFSPTGQDLHQRLQAPSARHWLGTDDLGRDVLARLLYGGRISMAVGFLAMLVALLPGVLVGLFSGYYGSWVDAVLMRLTEVFLAVPRIFVLLVLAMLLRQWNILGIKVGSFLPIALVIGLLAWMGMARLVRAVTLELRQREFILASTALGASDGVILFRHILPNVASPLIVSLTLGLAGAIITESGLSYLGLGVQLPTPTWGNMLSSAQNQLTTAPWTVIFPGLMIFFVVIAINYLGDGLRDALDPRHGYEL